MILQPDQTLWLCWNSCLSSPDSSNKPTNNHGKSFKCCSSIWSVYFGFWAVWAVKCGFYYQLVSFVPLCCPSFWKRVLICLNSRKQSIICPRCLVDVPGLSSVPTGRPPMRDAGRYVCHFFFFSIKVLRKVNLFFATPIVYKITGGHRFGCFTFRFCFEVFFIWRKKLSDKSRPLCVSRNSGCNVNIYNGLGDFGLKY